MSVELLLTITAIVSIALVYLIINEKIKENKE